MHPYDLGLFLNMKKFVAVFNKGETGKTPMTYNIVTKYEPNQI